ncbi:DUF1616 domain-containing protein (plasmid) [Haloferacaceae archaeon DSL9]
MTSTTLRSTLDLIFVAFYAALAGVVVLAGIDSTILRVLVGLPLLLFLPGYALIAVLYPERDTGPAPPADTISRPTAAPEPHTPFGRLGLSLAVSIGVVPLIAFAFNFTRFGLSLGPVVAATCAFTLLCVVVAIVVRMRIPAEERFTVDSFAALGGVRDRYFTAGTTSLASSKAFEARTGREVLFNLLLVGCVGVLLVSGVIAVGAFSGQVEPHSEFYLLEENQDGDLVGANNPMLDGFATLYPTITNNEGQTQTYMVVAATQTVDQNREVTSQTELERFSTELSDGETENIEHEVDVTGGDNERLVYLLYIGDAPEEPSIDNADEHLHVWFGDTDFNPEEEEAVPNDGVDDSQPDDEDQTNDEGQTNDEDQTNDEGQADDGDADENDGADEGDDTSGDDAAESENPGEGDGPTQDDPDDGQPNADGPTQDDGPADGGDAADGDNENGTDGTGDNETDDGEADGDTDGDGGPDGGNETGGEDDGNDTGDGDDDDGNDTDEDDDDDGFGFGF